MTDRHECPVCEQGHLIVEEFEDEIEHGGRRLTVRGLERCRCPVCGADPILTEQIRRNQLRFSDARRSADGLLLTGQIARVRSTLGITQADAAVLFGGGTNGFSKYERGEVVQSIAMDRLLRIVSAFPVLLNNLRLYAGLAPAAIAANDYELVRETEPASIVRFPHLRVVSSPKSSRPSGTWQPVRDREPVANCG